MRLNADDNNVEIRLGKESPKSRNGAVVTVLPGRAAQDIAMMARVRDHQDRAAFEELVVHYAPRLKAWLMCRGEIAASAEDIVHDVLLTVWRKSNLFDPEKASFSTWIFRVTRNMWIDHTRKRKRLVPVEPTIIADMVDAPVEDASKEEMRRQDAEILHRELALLPPDQKQMVHLSFFEGLTHTQIAERTGIALGTVKSRIRAPLLALRQRIEGFDGDVYE